MVSVIIPVFNVAPYLEKCLDSVRAQTYRDLQIILVDDGSTDCCPEICDRYAEMDERIEVIHKENGGLSSARNAGLGAVKGEYLYFLDSDDYIESVLVERCVDAIREQEADIVVFGYRTETAEGAYAGDFSNPPHIYVLRSKEDRIDFLAKIQTVFKKCSWNAWSRFFRTDLIMENGLDFPDNRRIFAEDLAHSMRCCLFADKITVITDILYHYVQRENSIMGLQKKPPLEKFIALFADFEDFAGEKGFQVEPGPLKNLMYGRLIIRKMLESGMNAAEMKEAAGAVRAEDRKLLSEWFHTVADMPFHFIRLYGLKEGLRVIPYARILRGV